MILSKGFLMMLIVSSAFLGFPSDKLFTTLNSQNGVGVFPPVVQEAQAATVSTAMAELYMGGQSNNTISMSAYSFDWIAPAGITDLSVEARAGGAGGGATNAASGAGGGGGGGGYAQSTSVSVSAGSTYTLSAGQGGAGESGGGANPGEAGGNSSLGTLVVADGGNGGGSGGSGAAGTGGTVNTGAVTYNGGSGSAGISGSRSGAGGGGAGDAAAGGAASGTTGGSGGSSGGGAGANGRTTNGSGNNATVAYGGGGSGGYRTSLTNYRGGSGMGGYVALDYNYDADDTFPIIRGISGARTGTSNTTAHPITLPPDIEEGDMLVVLFSVESDPTVTVGSGTNWSKLGEARDPGNRLTSAVFWKLADGGDTLSLTTSKSELSSYIVYRITNHRGVLSGTTASGNSTDSNPPSLSVGTVDNYLWLATRSGHSDVAATAAPSGYSFWRQADAGRTSSVTTDTAVRFANGSSENPGTWTNATEEWVSWTIAVPAASLVASISSSANQVFTLGQDPAPISTINIIDGSDTPTITTANDIRIAIATTTVDMRWDTTDTTATFGGTASAKVTNPVSYEDGGATLVIPVSTNFSVSDTLTVSGLSFAQFSATSTATSAIGINVANNLATEGVSAEDDKTVEIVEPVTPPISSAANQTFTLNQSTTTIATITITDDDTTPTITTANDIRIAIATSTVDMRWDTTDTTATFGGTASAKVTNPVSYEDGGATLVVPVSTNFSAGDTLTVSGLSFAQFGTLSAATSTLTLTASPPLGYDVSTAVFDEIALSVATQESIPSAMIFNDTGTVLYVSGMGGQDINAYTLSTPYDISTGIFDEIALSVATQDAKPRVMLFNGTGSVLYVLGEDGRDINAYTLSTPYDISTGIFDEIALSVVAQESKPYTMLFNNTGSVLYVIGENGRNFYAYTLSTPYDISTGIYDEIALSVGAQETKPFAAIFNNTGSVLYLLGEELRTILVYDLSTPYDISSGVYGGTTVLIETQESKPRAMLFNNTGSVLYVLGEDGDDINAYTLDVSEPVTAQDDKTVAITGSVIFANHDMGQIDNQFSFQNKLEAPLLTFKLTPEDEFMTVNETTIALSGIRRIDSNNLSNLRLYHDNNSNGEVDGEDTQLGGGGVLSINGQTGTITFTGEWSATTTQNYIVTGDITGVKPNEYLTFGLNANSLTAVGSTTEASLPLSGSLSSAQHIRGGNGGGASTAEIGGAPPAGDGIVGGGEEEGGGEIGEENDGENIGNELGFKAPTATGATHNEWTNGSNAYTSDGAYATAASTNLRQSYSVFGFSVPGGNSVQGIEVKLEASGSTAAGTIQVALSWNGDSSITTAKSTGVLTGTDGVYTLGGPSDTWGRSWTPAELNNTNFFARVIGQPEGNTVRLDAIQVRPYHQAGGGGAGGGDEL